MSDLTPNILLSPTSIVHLDYDPAALPPVPREYTRFVCISDTHGFTFPVPDGDVLLHSGDLTGTGTLKSFLTTMEWLYSLPHKIKLIIAGNHDLTLHEGWYEEITQRFMEFMSMQQREPIVELLKGPRAQAAGLVYLQDEKYEFQTKQGGRTWSVYGSPWSPEFCNWAFNYEEYEAEELISKFPKTDILLTHGPPANILDRTTHGLQVGCKTLATRLPTLRPRLHVFGHIHEARGVEQYVWDPDFGTPQSIRARRTNTGPLIGTLEEVEVLRREEEAGESAVPLKRSIFVNAANWPAGQRKSMAKGRKGGFGFQPIVVDLRD